MAEHTNQAVSTAEQATPYHRRSAVRVCPYCGHHTLVAKGQILTCRSCSETIWRSES